MGYHGDSLAPTFDPPAVRRLGGHIVRAVADAGHEQIPRWTPVKTGNLRSSWYLSPLFGARRISDDVWMVVLGTDVPYAPFVEEGTGLWGPSHTRYEILPRTHVFLSWIGADGQRRYARRVLHPGSKGQHMAAITANIVEQEADSIANGLVRAYAAELGARR